MSTEYPTSSNIKLDLDRFKLVGAGYCRGLSENKKSESTKEIMGRLVSSSAKIREKEKKDKNWTREYLSVKRISSALNFYH